MTKLSLSISCGIPAVELLKLRHRTTGKGSASQIHCHDRSETTPRIKPSGIETSCFAFLVEIFANFSGHSTFSRKSSRFSMRSSVQNDSHRPDPLRTLRFRCRALHEESSPLPWPGFAEESARQEFPKRPRSPRQPDRSNRCSWSRPGARRGTESGRRAIEWATARPLRYTTSLRLLPSQELPA